MAKNQIFGSSRPDRQAIAQTVFNAFEGGFWKLKYLLVGSGFSCLLRIMKNQRHAPIASIKGKGTEIRRQEGRKMREKEGEEERERERDSKDAENNSRAGTCDRNNGRPTSPRT